jgi:hypothetical protein
LARNRLEYGKEWKLYLQLRAHLQQHTKAVLQIGVTKSGDELLNFYDHRYKEYMFSTKVLRDRLDYLDRGWLVEQQELPDRADTKKKKGVHVEEKAMPLETLCLVVWRESVFESKFMSALFTAASEMVRRDRDGETIENRLVRGVTSCFEQMGADGSTPSEKLAIYKIHFETEFLQVTNTYYAAETRGMIDSGISVADFLAKVDSRIKEEVDRVAAYLHPTTLEPLMKTLDATLLTAHLDWIIGGCTKLLSEREIKQLHTAYTLLNRIDGGHDALRACVADHTKEIGKNAIRMCMTGEFSRSADPVAYVKAILQTIESADAVVKGAFCAEEPPVGVDPRSEPTPNVEFTLSVREAYIAFINHNPITANSTSGVNRSAELLGVYCDMIQKDPKLSASSDISAVMDGAVQIYGLFETDTVKEIFTSYYKKSLANRLVKGQITQKLNMDNEMLFVSKLKSTCGMTIISGLNDMFTDVSDSKDLLQEYTQAVAKAEGGEPTHVARGAAAAVGSVTSSKEATDSAVKPDAAAVTQASVPAVGFGGVGAKPGIASGNDMFGAAITPAVGGFGAAPAAGGFGAAPAAGGFGAAPPVGGFGAAPAAGGFGAAPAAGGFGAAPAAGGFGATPPVSPKSFASSYEVKMPPATGFGGGGGHQDMVGKYTEFDWKPHLDLAEIGRTHSPKMYAKAGSNYIMMRYAPYAGGLFATPDRYWGLVNVGGNKDRLPNQQPSPFADDPLMYRMQLPNTSGPDCPPPTVGMWERVGHTEYPRHIQVVPGPPEPEALGSQAKPPELTGPLTVTRRPAEACPISALLIYPRKSGGWPFKAGVQIKLPREVKLSLDHFESFYHKKVYHTDTNRGHNKCITWQLHHSLGEVQCLAFAQNFKGAAPKLEVSVHQLSVMMLFNCKGPIPQDGKNGIFERLTPGATSESDERRYLTKVLAELVKFKVLIEESGVYRVNRSWHYKLKRLTGSTGATAPGDDQASIKELKESRSYAVKARIVKIMKGNKKTLETGEEVNDSLRHEKLQELVVQELAPYFVPKESAIARAISKLIEESFLKRADGASKTYVYLP